ncbi:MAG: type II 3-dehydroquinate dehydratase [Proteobacteria bacterium]|nr:type II 3-dehydroquinate dehydratase [Pseudomonadota bacterium]
MKILVIHGPNLNLLGTREPDQYGTLTLEQINNKILSCAKNQNAEVKIFQANSEGEIISEIHRAIGNFNGIVINPAAYTHTSVALRDALLAVELPTVEVHLSNIYNREDFRKQSLISDVVLGVISGFREQSYILGLEALLHHLKDNKS